MRITDMASGKKIEVSLADGILRVGNLVIDLQKRQRDVQQMIDICLSNNELHEGMGDYYVAVVTIPPRQYVSNEGGEQIIMPFNEEGVAIALWSLPESYKAEANEEEEAK